MVLVLENQHLYFHLSETPNEVFTFAIFAFGEKNDNVGQTLISIQSVFLLYHESI